MTPEELAAKVTKLAADRGSEKWRKFETAVDKALNEMQGYSRATITDRKAIVFLGARKGVEHLGEEEIKRARTGWPGELQKAEEAAIWDEINTRDDIFSQLRRATGQGIPAQPDSVEGAE